MRTLAATVNGYVWLITSPSNINEFMPSSFTTVDGPADADQSMLNIWRYGLLVEGSTPCEPREDLFLVIAAGDVWFFGVCVDMGRRDFADWFEPCWSNKELPVGFSDCNEEDAESSISRELVRTF